MIREIPLVRRSSNPTPNPVTDPGAGNKCFKGDAGGTKCSACISLIKEDTQGYCQDAAKRGRRGLSGDLFCNIYFESTAPLMLAASYNTAIVVARLFQRYAVVKVLWRGQMFVDGSPLPMGRTVLQVL
jgi:hypothetical protein